MNMHGNLMRLKVVLISVISIWFSNSVCKAQSDTLFVLFSESNNDYIRKSFHHDIDSTSNYPLDFQRSYIIMKRNNNFIEKINFSYSPVYPSWMDSLYYKFESISILEQKDFKDQQWFEQTDYDKIVGTFQNAGVILLADKSRIKNDTLCLIKVFFHYPVDE